VSLVSSVAHLSGETFTKALEQFWPDIIAGVTDDLCNTNQTWLCTEQYV